MTHTEGQLPDCPPFPASVVELEPVTGRTHQLRLHLSSVGYPILGDSLYAPEEIRRLSPRLCLHAGVLKFIHPFTGEDIELNSPLTDF